MLDFLSAETLLVVLVVVERSEGLDCTDVVLAFDADDMLGLMDEVAPEGVYLIHVEISLGSVLMGC